MGRKLIQWVLHMWVIQFQVTSSSVQDGVVKEGKMKGYLLNIKSPVLICWKEKSDQNELTC